jgi:mannose-6-phosphate isomerase
MPVYPLIFSPIFKPRIWGSTNLRTVFGKDLPPATRIGESWELADLPEDKTVIRNGADAGLTLAEVIRREGRKITGRDDFPSPFPLLVKLLDCADVLSVQVHPDPQTCRRMGRGDFKTECWYVIRAEAGAFIYKGLRPGVTRTQFKKAIASGEVEGLLVKMPVRQGECHLLPAGTPHSIGAGLLIAEVQTPSDTTYRVFDWNRVDERGRRRQLHVAEALESIHFDASGDDLSVRSEGILADCPYFRIEKKSIALPSGMAVSAGRVQVIIGLTGDGAVTNTQTSVPFRAGDTLLIPADFSGQILSTAETCAYLSIFV